MSVLEIKDLHAQVGDKKILSGIDLKVGEGELHILLGTNGSGKSTLLNCIMGNPVYEVTKGNIKYGDEELLELEVDERAKLGIFMSFQNSEEIEGIRLIEFLRYSKTKLTGSQFDPVSFGIKMNKESRKLGLADGLSERYVNVGFSGGEKKKSEILQMQMLDPNLILLDEIDSGLDIDATKQIYIALKAQIEDDNKSIILVSHNIANVKGLPIDKVHVLKNGKIVKEGKIDLLEKIEKEGFEWING